MKRLKTILFWLIVPAFVAAYFVVNTGIIRDFSGKIVIAGRISASQIRMGDCLTNVGKSESMWQDVRGVPCSDKHDYRAYAETYVDVLGADLPLAVNRDALDFCHLALKPKTDYERNKVKYRVQAIAPSSESWYQGDRRILCVIGTHASPLEDASTLTNT